MRWIWKRERLLRCRGEFLERSFAHAYETGGMRRVYLRGQANVLKRVLIHLGGFNLSLIMRRRFGKGTPRGWQGFSADALLMGLQFWIAILARCTGKHIAANAPIFTCRARHHCCPVRGAVTKLLPPRAASHFSVAI